MQPFRIAHPFAIGTGHAPAGTGRDAYVRHLLYQVLFTEPGERVNRPDFGCGLRGLVFRGPEDASVAVARQQIAHTLQRELGELLQLDDVVLAVADRSLTVTVRYRLRGDPTVREATLVG